MKKITFFLSAILLCTALGVQSQSRVTVYFPEKTVTIDDARNLAQLVTNPALMDKTWWPGTIIAEQRATSRAVQQQQQLLIRLHTWRASLRAENQQEKASRIDDIYQQVAAIRVTGRQIVALDPDLLRIQPQANRRLAGEYCLYPLMQPTTLTIAGLVSRRGKIPWQPGKKVREYLNERQYLSDSDRNTVVLIKPDGTVREVPVAYWNHRAVEPEAGSVIYVGFSAWSLPAAYHDLNQQIIAVLTHRIPD